MKTSAKVGLFFVVVAAVAVGGSYYWLGKETAPTASTPKRYMRIASKTTWSDAVEMLQKEGLVRNAGAASLYSKINRKNFNIAAGTYEVAGGETLDELMTSLKTPISLKFRFPETNLSYRNANLLEKQDIAKADEYKALIKDPQKFQPEFGFTLPKDSLEGYLSPDTYNLPPLMGAEGVIQRQLHAFQQKVLPLLPDEKKRREILTVASLVELEAGVDKERAIIAGVIYNRIKKGMYLQIDAAILFAQGRWGRMYYKDYTNTESPYNLYKHKGLPPGPICSPSVKSIQAALHPDTHPYLYYVALPNGTSLFGSTVQEHNHNVALARKARDAAAKKK